MIKSRQVCKSLVGRVQAESGVSQNVTIKEACSEGVGVEEELTHTIKSSAAFGASSGDCGLAYLPPHLGTEA